MNTSEKIYSISVGVTGRCNLNCTYCHYFKSHSRSNFAYDISDEQFIVYMNFIKSWIANVDAITSFRFSGGEPMILGDRLFQLADKAFEIVGARPYILTAGKDLSQEWVDKARNSAISHLYVSIENPINPDSGSVDPAVLAKKIRKYNSEDLPIVPGVCVIPNNCFAHLYEICHWFYNEMGTIPLICEINYGAYKAPTDNELKELGDNLGRVVEDFFSKTHLNLFSSIIPEYAYGGIDPYLFELNLENSHQITTNNILEKITEIESHTETSGYPRLYCKQSDCPWIKFCQNTKWYWQADKQLGRIEKLENYCRLKRLISDVCYKVLVDNKHQATKYSIKED